MRRSFDAGILKCLSVPLSQNFLMVGRDNVVRNATIEIVKIPFDFSMLANLFRI